MRTKHSTITMSAPFTLTGVDQRLPAGEYAIDVDEELIEGPSWTGYRRAATYLHLPAIGVASGNATMIQIDHAELDAAVEADGGPSHTIQSL